MKTILITGICPVEYYRFEKQMIYLTVTFKTKEK